MKILYVSRANIPSRSANSIHVMKMCQAFEQNGHDTRLLAPTDTRLIANVDSSLWNQYGIVNTFSISWLKSSRILRGYDYSLRATLLARAEMAELVYTRCLISAAFSVTAGLRTILELHAPPPLGASEWLLRYFCSSHSRRSLVLISDALKDVLAFEQPYISRFKNCIVEHDGADLERFAGLPNPSESRRLLGLPDQFSAVYSGHLYPGRGIDLIEQVASDMPHINFLIIGGEPDTVNSWRRRTAQAGISNLTFIGFVPNSQVPAYLAAADVLLMPYKNIVATSGNPHGDISKYMSPMKMFEYMAAERPIIASDLPVLKEVLCEKSARFCSAEDPSGWVSQIKWIANNKVDAKSLASVAKQMVARYSWRERAARLANSIAPQREIQ